MKPSASKPNDPIQITDFSNQDLLNNINSQPNLNVIKSGDASPTASQMTYKRLYDNNSSMMEMSASLQKREHKLQ